MSTKSKQENTFTIPIHGKLWVINLLKENDPTLRGVLGFCDLNKQQIYVNVELPDQLFTSTIFHEYVHAACSLISSSRKSDDVIEEEMVCDLVGNGLEELLRNKGCIPSHVRRRLRI